MSLPEILEHKPYELLLLRDWYTKSEFAEVILFQGFLGMPLEMQWGVLLKLFDERGIKILCHQTPHGKYVWTLLGDKKSGSCDCLISAQTEAIQAAFEVL